MHKHTSLTDSQHAKSDCSIRVVLQILLKHSLHYSHLLLTISGRLVWSQEPSGGLTPKSLPFCCPTVQQYTFLQCEIISIYLPQYPQVELIYFVELWASFSLNIREQHLVTFLRCALKLTLWERPCDKILASSLAASFFSATFRIRWGIAFPWSN